MEEKRKKIIKACLLLLVTALVIVARCYYYSWPAATTVLVILFSMSTFGEWVAYSVYMSVFSCVSPIYASTLVLLLLATTLKYIKDVKAKKQPVHKLQLVMTTVLLLIWSLNLKAIDLEGFYQWGLVGGILYFVYFVYIYHNEIDIKKCFNTMFQALFLSSVLYLIFYHIGFLTEQIGMYRIQLFTLNVNYISMYCAFGLAYLLTGIMTNLRTKTWKETILSRKFLLTALIMIMLFVLGMHTLSKSFLIVFNAIIIYISLFILVRYKAKGIFPAFSILLVAGLSQYSLNGEFTNIINRFVSSAEEQKDVYEIMSVAFTARPEIWRAYLSFSTSSVFNMLFGAGLLAMPFGDVAPHNTLIYLLYRFGLFGIILLCALIYFYFRDAKNKPKWRISTALMLFVFLLFSVEEVMFGDRIFMFVILSYLILLKTDNPQPSLKENKNEKKE